MTQRREGLVADLRRDRTLLEVFRDACAGVCFLALAFAAVKLALLADVLGVRIAATAENVDRLVIITGGAMTNLEKATRSLKLQEDAEAQYVQLLSGKFSTIAEHVDVTIGKLNTTLDSLNVLVESSNANVVNLANDADATLKDLHPALLSLNAELEQLPEITKNLDAVMVETAPVLKNVELITADTAAVTADAKTLADHYTRQIMAPVNKAKAAAEIVGKYVVEFLGFAVGTHF